MKKKALVPILCVVLLVILTPGCGDNVLTLSLDILSFIDPASATDIYGDSPPIPPFAPIPIVIDSDVQELNLAEGLSDITDVERVDLYVSCGFANETGSADIEFMVFVSDTLTKPYDDNIPADRYVYEPFHVEPGVTDTLHAAVLANEKLGELLTSNRTRIGIRRTFDSSGSDQPVRGVATLIRFDAVITAKRHIP
jgi:hypothetical protein